MMNTNLDSERGVTITIRLREEEVTQLRNVVIFALENRGAVENYLDVTLNTNTLELMNTLLCEAKQLMIGG